MEREDTINMAIIESSPDEAEFIATELRNKGHVVKPHPVNNTEGLEDLLTESKIDVIFSSTDKDNIEESCQLVADRRLNIPVIAIASDTDTNSVINAMRAGARDLVSRNQPEHLVLVTERELASSYKYRSMDEFKFAYEESEKRCRTLLDSSRDAIAYIHDGMHIYANGVYLEMFGFEDMDDIEALPILDLVAEEEHKQFKEFISNYGKEQHTENVEVKCVRDDETEFDANMEFSRASIEGEPCTQVIIRDREVSQEMLEELESLKAHDALTGLLNRQAFLDAMQNTIIDVQKGHKTGVVFYIDIDNFEKTTLMLGIESIDSMISTVGKIVGQHITDEDRAARFGDHVFTVLTHEKDLKEIQKKATNLLKELDTIVETTDKSTQITCSLGITPIQGNIKSPFETLARADTACKAAMEKGGNTMQVYRDPKKEDEKKASQSQVQWVQRLKSALEENRFSLVYQPVVSLRDDPGQKYEVLLRMTDEDGSEVLPSEFLPAAESTGMINMIDRWVISRSLHLLTEKQAEGINLSLFIKLSGSVYNDEALLPWIYERIKAANIDPQHLIFEIKEADAISHIKQAGQYCRTLKKMRAQIVIGSFGLTPEPFKLLKTVHVDFLKVSSKLSSNIGTDDSMLDKLTKLVSDAHDMNKPVIAPHVENAQDMAVLYQCGFDFIQGNFLQEPDIEMGFDFGDNEASIHSQNAASI
ncbi:MAG: EAL domain-containing protein [Gammaproteobacteria bacterium]|nr:MAG: EAL domain-containing protein [Gammaproteobacteria bacterium]